MLMKHVMVIRAQGLRSQGVAQIMGQRRFVCGESAYFRCDTFSLSSLSILFSRQSDHTMVHLMLLSILSRCCFQFRTALFSILSRLCVPFAHPAATVALKFTRLQDLTLQSEVWVGGGRQSSASHACMFLQLLMIKEWSPFQLSHCQGVLLCPPCQNLP